MSFFEKLKNVFLLKRLRITTVNKLKTYLFFLVLIIVMGFRVFYKKDLDDTIFAISIDLIVVIVVLYVFTHMVKIFLLSSYRKRNKLEADHFDNLTIGLSSIVNIIFYMLVIVVIISYSNVDVKAFLTGFGLFFAGLAWVFKEHVVNVVNGLIIMFSRNFSIGDYILMNTHRGIIRNISFMSTEIKSDEGNITYIPNSLLLSSEVINFSKVNLKRLMFNFDFPSTHFNRIQKFENFLIDAIHNEFPELVKEVEIRVGKLKTKSANMIIEISLERYNFKIEKQVKDATKRKIMDFISRRS